MSDYPVFTSEMRSTHKILLPMMLPIHFVMVEGVLRDAGYDIDILTNDGPRVVEEGLCSVHNDTCYPALLVIGQMMDALKSGKYDAEHVALAITQTGGGCRASNYIFLLRKALARAGFGNVPVISLNLAGLEGSPGFRLSTLELLKVLCAFTAGDLLMDIGNQCRPYEVIPGSVDAVTARWQRALVEGWRDTKHPVSLLQDSYAAILADFAAIERREAYRLKVGIVGEIYMKYSPLGNNRLEEFLLSEGAEPVVPGVMDFLLYTCVNNINDHRVYGGALLKSSAVKLAYSWLLSLKRRLREAIAAQGVFDTPTPFEELSAMAPQYIKQTVRMGEGWLLTAEMAELIRSGVPNIVCVQPFGCLPNHIVGKGMLRELKVMHPDSNIVAVDYDPGASEVNQQNRIKMMLATARRAAGLLPKRRQTGGKLWTAV